MPRLRSFAAIVAVCILSTDAFLAAQNEVVRISLQTASARSGETRLAVGTSTISGAVVVAATGRPVGGARVMLNLQLPSNATASDTNPWLHRSTFTDANGQFSFPRLPQGQFTISARQDQFLPVNYGQRRHGGLGRAITLVDGQQVTLRIPMQRGGVITGTVLGPDGEPQRNARVRGLRYGTREGFSQLEEYGVAQTDDRGVYRMHGLVPGQYVVSATPILTDGARFASFTGEPQTRELAVERAITTGPVRPAVAPGFTATVAVPVFSPGLHDDRISQSYLPTYAPSSPLASGATKVVVTGDDEKAGVDILVQLTRASEIRGTILTQLDTVVRVQLMLISDDSTIDSPRSQWAPAERNGRFYFHAVPPGRYTIVSQTVPGESQVTYVNGQLAGPPTPVVLTEAQKKWARVPVVVAGESVIDVSVSLQASRSISGTVIFDMEKPPDLAQVRYTLRLNLEPSANPVHIGEQPEAKVGVDGRFTFAGVPPGRYRLSSDNGYLKSAVIGGQDTLDFPLEFTGEGDVTGAVLIVTDSAGGMSGTLTDTGGKPASGVTIIAVASDERFWGPGSRRIVTEQTNPEGRYYMSGLPAGVYAVAVVTDLEPGARYDPEFLRFIRSTGIAVTVADSAKVTLDLRVK